jgi:hypothetical protein
MRPTILLALLLHAWWLLLVCCGHAAAFVTKHLVPAFSRRPSRVVDSVLQRANGLVFATFEPQSGGGRDESDESSDIIEQPPTKEDPIVRRKKKGGGGSQLSSYKVMDNRDSLPFQIEHQKAPDPYTRNTDVKQRKKQNNNKVRKNKAPGSPIENGLASSLYTTSSNNNTDDDDDDDPSSNNKTLLGEFVLDKYTTTGDIVEIGNVQYKVVRHKCQYKYAGGKRFVMVRKILQVKEIGRLQQEEYLKRQWQQST